MRTGRQFTRMRNRRAGETLESCRRRVNAERNSVAIDLVLNEAMQLVLDFGDTRQFTLPKVVERPLGHRLKVPRVLPSVGARAGAGAGAAAAHAGVVAEPSFVEVRVVESLLHSRPLLGVQGQHLA